jgi:hypothetical protein
MTRDISGYGAFIHSDSVPVLGETVQVIVNTPPLQGDEFGTQLYGKGVVVRLEPGDACAPKGFATEVVFQSGWASALSHACQAMPLAEATDSPSVIRLGKRFSLRARAKVWPAHNVIKASTRRLGRKL